MTGVRSQRALARAQQLLALAQPPPHDADVARLRELASRYLDEAERREREGGQFIESAELVSATLDKVAKDYFDWALRKARDGMFKRGLRQSTSNGRDRQPALPGP
jgi:hypothetical protein